MTVSGIGQLVLYLNERADREGRLKVLDMQAELMMCAVAGMYDGLTTPEMFQLPLSVLIGLELRSGRIVSERGKTIRRAALSRLNDYDVFLGAVDDIGYTAQVVRAALTVHWSRLSSAYLGSDGHCVYLDIATARDQAPENVRTVITLLPAMGPQELGVAFQTNGSRLVGRCLSTLSRILNGKQPQHRKRSAV